MSALGRGEPMHRLRRFAAQRCARFRKSFQLAVPKCEAAVLQAVRKKKTKKPKNNSVRQGRLEEMDLL